MRRSHSMRLGCTCWSFAPIYFSSMFQELAQFNFAATYAIHIHASASLGATAWWLQQAACHVRANLMCGSGL